MIISGFLLLVSGDIFKGERYEDPCSPYPWVEPSFIFTLTIYLVFY